VLQVTERLLRRIDDTWGTPECPTDWIQLPSQRRWEYETTLKLLDVPAGSRVLDVGGGEGYLSYIMSGQYEVVFNDRHDCYRQPAAPVQKVIGSFFTLPETTSYDAIACVSVMEHVPPGDRARWLEKIYRLLRPGGIAILTFEWHEDTVFDIGDGLTLTTSELTLLWANMQLRLAEQLTSPTRSSNSRGWLPLAVRLVREA